MSGKPNGASMLASMKHPPPLKFNGKRHLQGLFECFASSRDEKQCPRVPGRFDPVTFFAGGKEVTAETAGHVVAVLGPVHTASDGAMVAALPRAIEATGIACTTVRANSQRFPVTHARARLRRSVASSAVRRHERVPDL